jgi:hypothetical protein
MLVLTGTRLDCDGRPSHFAVGQTTPGATAWVTPPFVAHVEVVHRIVRNSADMYAVLPEGSYRVELNGDGELEMPDAPHASLSHLPKI